MLKKVLKFTAKLVPSEKAGKRNVLLSFQFYRENLTYTPSKIIVYRREEPNFIFDCDEEEYFDGLVPKESDVIFEGELEIKDTFAEYLDTTAEEGKTYAYWVGKETVGQAITGPVAVKVRNGKVWLRFDEILEETNRLKSEFPSVKTKQIGKTVLGKPLISIRVGNPDNLICLVGGVHAGESGPELLFPAVRYIIEKHSDLLEKVGIVMLPSVNADMRDVMAEGAPWYIRKNAAGVDLNRNFDADFEYVDHSYGLSSIDPRSFTYRGPYPNSEPETEALISLMEEIKPKAVFSYHALCSVTADLGVSSRIARDDSGYMSLLVELAKVYSPAFRAVLNGPPRENYDIPMICTSGSLITWLYHRGIPAFDMEMSHDLTMLTPTMKDHSTPEMVDLASQAHTAGILAVMKHFA
ncbi:MAG: hypothetical protein IJY69_02455 [Clostridia bacterium]|nr:hypothetical protein [Clostridia bacterium]